MAFSSPLIMVVMFYVTNVCQFNYTCNKIQKLERLLKQIQTIEKSGGVKKTTLGKK
jgi:hypothetical protein